MPLIPRWAAIALAPVVLLIVVPIVHGGLPWAISTVGARHGWSSGGPGLWNLSGLALIASGIAILIWLLATGIEHAGELPQRIALNWGPKVLLTSGPYALSRHPMYLAELALWLGCAVFFGSIPVFVGFALVTTVADILAAREERALEAAFGGEYRRYKSAVPRWLDRRLLTRAFKPSGGSRS